MVGVKLCKWTGQSFKVPVSAKASGRGLWQPLSPQRPSLLKLARRRKPDRSLNANKLTFKQSQGTKNSQRRVIESDRITLGCCEVGLPLEWAVVITGELEAPQDPSDSGPALTNNLS